MVLLQRICLSISLSSVLFGMSTVDGLAQSTEHENAITTICLLGFNAAMANAGKTPPAGMGQFTCQCFLDQVNAGEVISSAQSKCQAKAGAHYDI